MKMIAISISNFVIGESLVGANFFLGTALARADSSL